MDNFINAICGFKEILEQPCLVNYTAPLYLLRELLFCCLPGIVELLINHTQNKRVAYAFKLCFFEFIFSVSEKS